MSSSAPFRHSAASAKISKDRPLGGHGASGCLGSRAKLPFGSTGDPGACADCRCLVARQLFREASRSSPARPTHSSCRLAVPKRFCSAVQAILRAPSSPPPARVGEGCLKGDVVAPSPTSCRIPRQLHPATPACRVTAAESRAPHCPSRDQSLSRIHGRQRPSRKRRAHASPLRPACV